MKLIQLIKKVYRTFACVSMYLPEVVKEVGELTGVTRVLVIKLKEIWNF